MCAERRSYVDEEINNVAKTVGYKPENTPVIDVSHHNGEAQTTPGAATVLLLLGDDDDDDKPELKLPPVIRQFSNDDKAVFETTPSTLSRFDYGNIGGDPNRIRNGDGGGSITQRNLRKMVASDKNKDALVANDSDAKKNYSNTDLEKGDKLIFDSMNLEDIRLKDKMDTSIQKEDDNRDSASPRDQTDHRYIDDSREDSQHDTDHHDHSGDRPGSVVRATPLVQAQLSASSLHTAVWPTQEQLEDFASREKHRKARRYYRKQIDLVKNFQEDKAFVDKFATDEDEAKRDLKMETVTRSDDILAKISLIANILLLAAKSVAAALSGSLVVIGTVVDSATDITSGLVIYLTNRAIVKRDLYKYPRGRTRLQPIALIIISVIMGACSVQVISKSLESIGTGKLDIDVEIPTICIMIATIVTKFCLMIACFMYRSPACSVLAQDHRNDVISNSIALICAYLANKYWKYLDPIAAIIVSCYILFTWLRTGNEHVKALSGKAAKPEFINRIVKICLDHRPPLKQIDTVYAYHYGTKYLVEIDVVLDKNLSLKDAHDIAEPLQRKIEYLPDVERAFVHIDYETEHRPDYEHKVV